MSREEMDFATRFWNILCGFEFMLLLLFVFSTTFVVLIALTYFLIETDAIGRVMLRLSLLFLGVLLPSITYCIYRCRERES